MKIPHVGRNPAELPTAAGHPPKLLRIASPPLRGEYPNEQGDLAVEFAPRGLLPRMPPAEDAASPDPAGIRPVEQNEEPAVPVLALLVPAADAARETPARSEPTGLPSPEPVEHVGAPDE